ncbi:uncharacterized protein LOC142177366 [Nicotiana tabacum]|uniref:Uncharacterized protein LOC142177366 n=1 Tax=Nicotiana tabacum TaxID=4097 RepID=A0AC58TXG5_TOBAC
MRNIKGARVPRPMRSDPSQRDPNLWCEYDGTNGYRTGDCRHLHEEVAALMKNGHLRKFLSDRAKNNYGHNWDNAEPSKAEEGSPRLTINMIFRGNEINGVTFSERKRQREFSQYYPMESTEPTTLTRSIIPATKFFAGFNLASVTTRGEILLPTNAEGVMKMTFFEVVNGNIGYNIILGRPWLHEMKAVPSSYHRLLKFPTLEGIKQVRGDQPAAREMNAILVSSSKGKEHAA